MLDEGEKFLIHCHQTKYHRKELYLHGLKHISLSTERIHLSYLIQFLFLKKTVKRALSRHFGNND